MLVADEYAFYLAGVAQAAIDSIAVAGPALRVAIVVSGPMAADHAVYSNADAAQLAPVLQAVLARLESGTLVRLPVTDGVRWMDVAGVEC